MQVLERDARWLLKEKYDEEKCPEYFKDLERLSTGEPIAYVIGWIPFMKANIKLNHRPLIPRPETEYWANEAFRIIEKTKGHLNRYSFADCYSGSGCIGVASLMYFPKAQCTFIDIGKDECSQIEENIKNNVLHKERATVLLGDVSNMLCGPYDVIFANPPYIKPNANDVDDSVTKWEPYRALYAEDDGLREIKKLLTVASYHLNSDGIIFCEFGKGQEDEIRTMKESAIWNMTFYKDQYGVTRWFEARKR